MCLMLDYVSVWVTGSARMIWLRRCVRTRKELARPWVDVRVCHFPFVVCCVSLTRKQNDRVRESRKIFPNGRKDSRVTITPNKETTVFKLQNMFRHSHVIFSGKWAFNGCTFEFYIKVRYKITRQNLRYNLIIKYAENKNSDRITRTIKT